MPHFNVSQDYFSHLWEVLLLFVIPIGGGIPGGVVLAQKYGLAWQMMAVLYFISDVILACVFEPLMLAFLHASRKSPKMDKIRAAMAAATQKSVARYGISPGPLTLIFITFGTDPMTGRSVARAAGHGFLIGWTLTIIGDMGFFFVLMASTLWLNGVLGDGTAAALIVMVAMMVIPALIRKVRAAVSGERQATP